MSFTKFISIISTPSSSGSEYTSSSSSSPSSAFALTFAVSKRGAAALVRSAPILLVDGPGAEMAVPAFKALREVDDPDIAEGPIAKGPLAVISAGGWLVTPPLPPLPLPLPRPRGVGAGVAGLSSCEMRVQLQSLDIYI